MKVISHRTTSQRVTFQRVFQRIGEPTMCGFAFASTESGELLSCTPTAYYSYEQCLAHPELYRDDGVERTVTLELVPMRIECDCGAHLDLDGDTVCDHCKRWYNSAGQTLVDPSGWGEETGERFDSNGRLIR